MDWPQDFLRAAQQAEAFPAELSSLPSLLSQVLDQAVLTNYGPWTKFGQHPFFFFLYAL